MAKNGRNLAYLRATNQGTLLKTILLSGSCTRLDLASALNLTAMSISFITSDLLEKGILCEVIDDTRSNVPGRHSAKLSLVPEKVTAIGISISRSIVRVTLTDLLGTIMYNQKTFLDETTTSASLTEFLIESVQKILDLFPRDNILGIGISSIGIVDTRQGMLSETTNFFGISDWPIANILQEHFQMTTYILEDMKASALAEFYFGSAKNYSDFVYLGITNGIGVGVLANGKLFEGHSGFAGEIGHVTLYNHGEKCPCGNVGCAEMYLSIPVILKKAGLSRWIDFLAFCEREPDNPILAQFIDDVGTVLVTIANLFDPQAIIIGHEGSMLNHDCYQKMQEFLSARAVTRRLHHITVRPSSLFDDRIAYLNAPAVIFSRLFQGDFKL